MRKKYKNFNIKKIIFCIFKQPSKIMAIFLKLFTIPAHLLHQLISGHFHFLKQSLNPVIELNSNDHQLNSKCSSSKSLSTSFNVCFAILIHVYTVFYGIFGFIKPFTITNIKTLSKNELLYTHQLTPSIAWPQVDTGFAMDITVSLAIFIILSLKNNNLKFKIFYHTSLKEMSINEKSMYKIKIKFKFKNFYF